MKGDLLHYLNRREIKAKTSWGYENKGIIDEFKIKIQEISAIQRNENTSSKPKQIACGLSLQGEIPFRSVHI